MKKFIKSIGVLALASVFLISCNKDDDNNGVGFSKDALVGTWKYTKEREAVNGVWGPETAYVQSAAECGEDKVEFKANNTYADTYYEMTTTCETYIDNGTFTVTANTITSNSGDGDFTVSVVSFDGSTMVIEDAEVYEGINYVYRTTLVKTAN